MLLRFIFRLSIGEVSCFSNQNSNCIIDQDFKDIICLYKRKSISLQTKWHFNFSLILIVKFFFFLFIFEKLDVRFSKTYLPTQKSDILYERSQRIITFCKLEAHFVSVLAASLSNLGTCQNNVMMTNSTFYSSLQRCISSVYSCTHCAYPC